MPKNSFLLQLASLMSAILAMHSAAEASEQEVVVSLFKAHEPITQVYLAGPFRLDSGAYKNRAAQMFVPPGIYRLSFERGTFLLSNEKKPTISGSTICTDHLKLLPVSNTIAIGVKADKIKHYRGSLQIIVDGKILLCKNTVAFRDYVNSVVGSESKIDFPKEALKAQSVLVQTAMLRYRKNDDLNDSTEKQAYLGADYVSSAVKQAVDETWGQALYCENRPVPIYFHSCCAGKTSASNLFTGKASGLPCDQSVECRFCKDSAFCKPTKTLISQSTYLAKFPEGIPEISSKDSAGRPSSIKYSASTVQETGYQFWLKIGQRFSWGAMPGTRFDFKDLKNGKIELSSTGAGHGVGLCQSGAAGMAKTGVDYTKILQFYFPGSSLKVPGKNN